MQVRFVLVRPANALNIGAVARAMANFRLDDLVIVDPSPWSWRDARSAVYESRVKDRTVSTVAEALEGCDAALGTASAHNRVPRQTLVDLPALPRWRSKHAGKLAVLFGSERSGLSNDDLSHCRALLRIPTSAEAPSMNLGQAAAVVAYTLASPKGRIAEPALERVERAHMDALVETALAAMAKVKVNAHMSEGERRRKLRLGFLRWKMSDTDATWLAGLFRRLAKPR